MIPTDKSPSLARDFRALAKWQINRFALAPGFRSNGTLARFG